MKILSLDQSTVATGWAYFSSNSLVQHGVIHINSKNKALPKWIMMMNDICNLIDAYCPNIVIIEDTIMQKSTNTLKELTRLQGALIWYCFLKKIEVTTMYPSHWRKVIDLPVKRGMKRVELKSIAKEFVETIYGQQCITDDESDAICIGMAYIKEYLQENKEINYE